jgi:hypothetical protein
MSRLICDNNLISPKELKVIQNENLLKRVQSIFAENVKILGLEVSSTGSILVFWKSSCLSYFTPKGKARLKMEASYSVEELDGLTLRPKTFLGSYVSKKEAQDLFKKIKKDQKKA